MLGVLIMLFAFILLRFPSQHWPTWTHSLVGNSGWGMLLAGLALTFASSIETGLVALGGFLVLYNASLGEVAAALKAIPILANIIAALAGLLIFTTGIILSFMVSPSLGWGSLFGVAIAAVIIRELEMIELDMMNYRVLCNHGGTQGYSEIIHAKNQRILVIDDNPHIHMDWRQLLEGVDANIAIEEQFAIFGASSDSAKDVGFEIDSAFQGQEGLDKIRQALKEERPYVMAIVDIRMPPGWDGVSTIEHILEVCPELHIVICAAYSDYTWSDIVERMGRSKKLVMLKYPFNKIEVHQFAIGLAEKVGCKLSARIERALKQMAESMRPRVANVQR